MKSPVRITTALLGVAVMSVSLLSAIALAPSASAANGDHIANNTASLPIHLAGDSDPSPEPQSWGIIPNPNPRKPKAPADCGVPTVTVIPGTPGSPAIRGPHGKLLKPAVPAVPERTETTPSTCNPNSPEFVQPGDSYLDVTYGFASWPSSQVIFGDEDLNYGGYGGGGLSRPLPNGLVDQRYSGYTGQCRTESKPFAFDGWVGRVAPRGLGFFHVINTKADANRDYQEIANYVVYLPCIWPEVTGVSNTCPAWVDNVYATGPLGKGLPVPTGDGTYVPGSEWSRSSPLRDISTNQTRIYSPIGRAVANGSYNGLPDRTKANLIADCRNEDISATFGFKPTYYGNWKLAGPGSRVKCGYIEFADMRKFTGCHAPTTWNYEFDSYLACDGKLYEGTADLNYNFRCQKPTGTCIEAGPCPVPDPDPTWDGPFDPTTDVKCTYQKPTITTPQGSVIPAYNGLANVSANGQPYRVDWGDMIITGAPRITKQWTDFFVTTNSSPGNNQDPADDSKQPMTGTLTGGGKKNVLMWEDTEDLNNGITDSDKWENSLDLHFYRPGDSGKTFTVIQDRSFTWTKTMRIQNWDGSYTTQDIPITETCQSVPATFKVVQGRNTGSGVYQ